MNKINFRIGCEIVYYIITLDKSKSLRFIDLDNRNYIIFIKYISVID